MKPFFDMSLLIAFGFLSLLLHWGSDQFGTCG